MKRFLEFYKGSGGWLIVGIVFLIMVCLQWGWSAGREDAKKAETVCEQSR